MLFTTDMTNIVMKAKNVQIVDIYKLSIKKMDHNLWVLVSLFILSEADRRGADLKKVWPPIVGGADCRDNSKCKRASIIIF